MNCNTCNKLIEGIAYFVIEVEVKYEKRESYATRGITEAYCEKCWNKKRRRKR